MYFQCSIVVAVWPLRHVWLFETPWTAARQASLSFTVSWSLFKLMSIELAWRWHPTRVFFNWSTQELFSHVAEHIFTYLFLTILDYSWVLTSLLNKSLDLVNHMLIYNFFGLSSISTIFVPIVKITPIVMALLSCRILTSFVAQLTLTFFFQMSVQTWFFKYLWTSSTILLILIN